MKHSAPPHSRSPDNFHHPPRGGGDLCCGCCLCRCILNCICQLLCTILLLVAIVAVIFWAIFRPNPVNFHVTGASLTQFDLSPVSNTLNYNLDLNMTIRNSNKKIGIYYDDIEATALYQGQQFATTKLDQFYEGHKSTDYLNPVFNGQNFIFLKDDDLSKYNFEKTVGTFSINVKVYVSVRFKLFLFRTPTFKSKVNCDLNVPLESDDKAVSANFETTRCYFHWRL